MVHGNFHRRLEPSVSILFISLLQITNGSEDLMGTPTGFLLLQTPRVAHMWDTDLRDLLQGCTLTVAQHGLLWSRTTARQEMISSLHSGPTFAQSSSTVSKLDLAYQLLRASCLCAKEKGMDSIYLSSQALNLAKRCSSFSGGFKTSQQFS